MFLLFLLICIYILYKYNFFSVMHPNLMTFYLMFIYLFSGSILSEFYSDYTRVVHLMYLVVTAITLSHIANYYFFGYKKYVAYSKNKIIQPINKSYKLFYLILLSIHLVLVIVYLIKYGLIILHNNVEYNRTIVLHNDKILFYNLLLLNSVIVIYTYFLYNKIVYYIVLIVSILILLSTGFRALPFNLIVIHIILYSYIKGMNLFRINIKTILYIIFIFLLLLYITIHRISDGNILSALQALLYRIFTNNIDNINNIMKNYNINSYLLGKGYLWDFQPIFRAFFFPLGIERVHTFAEYITAKLNPNSQGIFVMTPTIVGAAYANFSYMGVFVIIFFINIVQFLLAKKMLLKVYLQPLLIYFTYLGAVIVSRGFASVYSLYLFPIIVIIAIMIFVTIVVRINRKKGYYKWKKYQLS